MSESLLPSRSRRSGPSQGQELPNTDEELRLELNFDNLTSLSVHRLCAANYQALKNILLGAPSEIRDRYPSLPRSIYKLLGIVLEIRERFVGTPNVSPGSNYRNDQAKLEKLLALTFDEVENLSTTDLPALVNLVHASLRADPELQPREFDQQEKSSVVRIVSRWQLQATRAALHRRETQLNPIEDILHTQEQDARPKRSNPFSASHESGPPFKKQKVLKLAGVPTGEEDDDRQDFLAGIGGAAPIRPSQLRAYPGRTTVLLNVQELMGPSILHSFCQEGLNIELVVRNIRWPRHADGRPFNSEIEALTLARCLHFHLCKHTTMEEAVLAAPWTEIALRRLWSILEVQTLSSGPTPLTREEAWQQVLPSLEVYPDIGIRVPAMRTIVNRQVSAASRARNAVRSLTRRSAPHANGRKPNPDPKQ